MNAPRPRLRARAALRAGWDALVAAPGTWVLITLVSGVPGAVAWFLARGLDPRFGDRTRIPFEVGPVAAELVAAVGGLLGVAVLARAAWDRLGARTPGLGRAVRVLALPGVWSSALSVALASTIVCLVNVPAALLVYLLAVYVPVVAAGGRPGGGAVVDGIRLLGRGQPGHAGLLVACALLVVLGVLTFGVGLLAALPVSVVALAWASRELDPTQDPRAGYPLDSP